MSERTSGYTTRQAADASGLSTSKVLSWTRAGLLSPGRDAGGKYVFSFQDVVLLRTARSLLDARVPPRKLRMAVEALRRQLPSGRPLSAVQIAAVGDSLLARDDESVWEPHSGQMQLDLGPTAPAARPLEVAVASDEPAADDAAGARTADDWYNAGLDLEAEDPAGAAVAYRRALELDLAHAYAHLNLGRLLHEAGDLEAAERHYRAAIAADPRSAGARFNLGVVLEDRGRAEQAIAAYREAVRLDELLAPAHFNLARLHEARGDGASAIAHLMAYKKLLTSRRPSAS